MIDISVSGNGLVCDAGFTEPADQLRQHERCIPSNGIQNTGFEEVFWNANQVHAAMGIWTKTKNTPFNQLPAVQEVLCGTLRAICTHSNYIGVPEVKYLPDGVIETFAKCGAFLLGFIYRVKGNTWGLNTIKGLLVQEPVYSLLNGLIQFFMELLSPYTSGKNKYGGSMGQI